MTTSCVDCGRDISRRDSTMVAVHMDKPDGGYDRVRMPACHRCALERRGYECSHCGELHMDQQAAYECCIGQTKAPDCLECGRRMKVTASGFDPERGPDITVAECECCPVLWGRFTGWEQTGDGPCKHINQEGRSGPAPEAEGSVDE